MLPRNVLTALFLLFAAFSYSFGCQDSPAMDFGGFNSAEKTLPSPSFSPVLDISSQFEIHLHQRHFHGTSVRRNMRVGRESFDDLLSLLRGYFQREREHLIQKLYAA